MSRGADKVARSVTHSSYPTLSPFALFKSHLTTCSGGREVCFRGPRGGGRDCAPEGTLGGGVDLCSGVWLKRTSLCLSPGRWQVSAPGEEGSPQRPRDCHPLLPRSAETEPG